MASPADYPTVTLLVDRVRRPAGARVRKVILFGSRARGDARPDSDYDLLIVRQSLAPEERASWLLSLYRALRSFDVTVEPHVMGEEEFEETKTVIGGLAYPAWTEGVLLYENP